MNLVSVRENPEFKDLGFNIFKVNGQVKVVIRFMKIA